MVQTVVKVAEKSPKKMLILQDVVAMFKSVGSKNREKTRVSVLQLQFLKHRNRVKEHSDSVKNLSKEYGSIRKASLNLECHTKHYTASCCLEEGNQAGVDRHQKVLYQ